MKKFIVYVIKFSLIILFVFAAIELSLLFILNTYSYKRDYIESNIDNIEILFMGNSYIEEGVRPEIVGNGCFNIAISGRNIVYDAEIAKKYFHRMHRLRVVIMPLDYSKFEFGRGHKNPQDTRIDLDRMTVTYKCMHLKYMNLYVDDFWYWSEILNSQLNFISRFWQSRQENVECDSLGYVKLDISKKSLGWEYRSLPPIIDDKKAINSDSFIDYWPYFKIIADYAEKNDVKLILVNTPKYKTYKKDINRAIVQEMNKLICDLQCNCKNVLYWDFTYENIFEEDDFYDACHLSDVGAYKFSIMLRNRIQDL